MDSGSLFSCFIPPTGNWQVSWVKYSEDSVHLLTVGNGTYSNDNRLAIAWRYPGNWTLQISSVELQDTGCYQCQVYSSIAYLISSFFIFDLLS